MCGSSRRSPASRRWVNGSTRATVRSTTRTWSRCASRCGTCPIVEFAGIATTAAVVGIGGWMVHQGEVSLGTVGLVRAVADQPVRAGAAAQPAVQHRASRRRPASTSCSACSTPRPIVPERKGAVDLPEHGEVDVDGVWFSYSGTGEDERCCATSTSRSPRANGWRSSDRPAPASRRSRSWSPASTTPSRARSRSAGSICATRPLRSLRDRIVVVPQEGFLFNGSIRDNVRIARADATDAEVDAALAVVGADERFAVLPDGLDNRGARARQPAVGGRAAARVVGAGRARRPGGARARRGDVEPRPGHRGDGRAGHGSPDGRPHGHRDRSPLVDRRAGRSCRRRRSRTTSSSSASHAELLAQGGRYAALYGSWAGSAPR